MYICTYMHMYVCTHTKVITLSQRTVSLHYRCTHTCLSLRMLSCQFQFPLRVNAFACRNNEILHTENNNLSLSLSLSLSLCLSVSLFFFSVRSDLSDNLYASVSRRIADYLRKKLSSPSIIHSDG